MEEWVKGVLATALLNSKQGVHLEFRGRGTGHSSILVVGDVGRLGAALGVAGGRPDAVFSGRVLGVVPGAGALQDAAVDLELLRAEVKVVTAPATAPAVKA